MKTSLKQLLTEQTKFRSYKEMIKDLSSKNRLQVKFGSGRTVVRDFDQKRVEELMDEVLRYLFLDKEFYHNFADYDYKNDYKDAITNKFFSYVKKDFKLLKKLIDIKVLAGEAELEVKRLNRKEQEKLYNAAFNKIKNQVSQELVTQWKEYQERR